MKAARKPTARPDNAADAVPGLAVRRLAPRSSKVCCAATRAAR